jgi:hypothetical protein
MNNFFKTKSEKVWATISAVWIFLVTVLSNVDSYSFNWSALFLGGILPVSLGWIIYFIWKK